MLIEKNIPLSEFATFKIGGKADYFCRVQSLEELKEALFFAKQKKAPIFILGGGSNILVSDKGFRGLVIKMEILGIEFNEQGKKKNSVEVTAGAGENWDYLVSLCVEKGLYGLENLSGIPGTVGGAIFQNIGAYGAEISECVSSVEALNIETGEIGIIPAKNCAFSYRSSIFKDFSSSPPQEFSSSFPARGKVPRLCEAEGWEKATTDIHSHHPVLQGQDTPPQAGGEEAPSPVFSNILVSQSPLIILSATFSLQKNGTLKTSYKDISAYFSSLPIPPARGGTASLRARGVGESIVENLSHHPCSEDLTSPPQAGGEETQPPISDSPFPKGSTHSYGGGIFPNLSDLRNAILSIRSRKLPPLDKFGTAGSFFKNPIISKKEYEEFKKKFPDCPANPVRKNKIKISAGWLLDKACNLKGAREGDAGLYENQALVLVNYGSASASEIKSFAEKAVACVLEKTGIILEREVEYV